MPCVGAFKEQPMNQGQQIRVNHENKKNEVSTPSEVEKKDWFWLWRSERFHQVTSSLYGWMPSSLYCNQTLTTHIRHTNTARNFIMYQRKELAKPGRGEGKGKSLEEYMHRNTSKEWPLTVVWVQRGINKKQSRKAHLGQILEGLECQSKELEMYSTSKGNYYNFLKQNSGMIWPTF